MTETVVVLGAGYAGTGAVQRLKSELDPGTDVVWISEHDYHLVLHEVHRVVRDPDVADRITIPTERVAGDRAEFVQGRVEDVAVDDRTVVLADGRTVDYDYLLVALGSRTAFYGIPGLRDDAHTLKSLDDALAIHEDVAAAAEAATPGDPARVVVGGAGLSGIQTAGEVARYRDDHDAPVEVHLVEALEEIFPGNDPEVQSALRRELEAADVHVSTDDPVTEATGTEIQFEAAGAMDYDVFVWTGGVTGGEPLGRVEVDRDDRSNRIQAGETFRTSDDRVFAIGDAAMIDQGDSPAPPTAQAAWQAAEVAGINIARAIEGKPLQSWEYEDKGTLVSIGETAIAHDVVGMPVKTFNSYPAKFLKKFVAARWIAGITSWRRAMRAWSAL
ncbi:NADH dehydrogenase FAD-containing subunit [Halobacteriales archaeon QS_8_69_26]|nr:MAG: NADH dehydrogenase FAD-containing subunit [Halobacteriales archaeon QS_8_69_26]